MEFKWIENQILDSRRPKLFWCITRWSVFGLLGMGEGKQAMARRSHKNVFRNSSNDNSRCDDFFHSKNITRNAQPPTRFCFFSSLSTWNLFSCFPCDTTRVSQKTQKICFDLAEAIRHSCFKRIDQSLWWKRWRRRRRGNLKCCSTVISARQSIPAKRFVFSKIIFLKKSRFVLLSRIENLRRASRESPHVNYHVRLSGKTISPRLGATLIQASTTCKIIHKRFLWSSFENSFDERTQKCRKNSHNEWIGGCSISC